MPIYLCSCRMAATLGVVGLTLPQPMGVVDLYIIQRPLLGAGKGVYVGPMVFKSQVDADLFGPGTLQPFSSTTISNRLKQLSGFHSEVCKDRFIISKAAGCGLVVMCSPYSPSLGDQGRECKDEVVAQAGGQWWQGVPRG